MRQKALSPAQRRPEIAPPEPAATSPWRRTWIFACAMLVVVAAGAPPSLVTRGGGATLTADRAEVLPGSVVRISGSGFTPRARGFLSLDGAATGPSVRVGRDGGFLVRLEIPGEAASGPHRVDAMMEGLRSGRRAAGAAITLAATMTLLVVAPADAPAPPPGSAEPSASATTAPTTASPEPTPEPTQRPTQEPTAQPTVRPTTQPTAEPTPPDEAVDPQPALPVRAAFYYPWFPEAWNQQGLHPFTRYLPTLGLYDGGTDAVIGAHISAMQYGRIEVGIASWWGIGTRTDGRIDDLLRVAAPRGFRWAVYHEGEGQGDPSVAALRADLDHLAQRYGSHPGHFRIGGRFVVFVYAEPGDGCAMVDRWTAANAGRRAYLVLKVFSGYRSCAAQPDGWHQYGPAVAEDSQAGYSYAISPGFWKANEPSARLSRDLDRWAASVRRMVASAAPFQLITTFNEWGEGTSVESALDWATASGQGAYLDILHANGR